MALRNRPGTQAAARVLKHWQVARGLPRLDGFMLEGVVLAAARQLLGDTYYTTSFHETNVETLVNLSEGCDTEGFEVFQAALGILSNGLQASSELAQVVEVGMGPLWAQSSGPLELSWEGSYTPTRLAQWQEAASSTLDTLRQHGASIRSMHDMTMVLTGCDAFWHRVGGVP